MDTVEKESLKLVLEEFTQEQEKHSKSIGDLITAVNGLTDKFKGFEEKLEKPNQITVSTDTKPIQEIVRKGILDMRLTVAGQPKNVLRKFQLLLFPERDAKSFYKVVFSRWFLWLVVMLFLTDLYKFSIHWDNNRKEVTMQQLEDDRIKRAWDYLYNNHSKGVKRLMDTAYIKSEKLIMEVK